VAVPPSVDELVRRGRSQEREQDWAAAAREYRRAVTREPGRADCWRRLGLVLYRQRDWVAAAQAYRMLVTLHEATAVDHYRLGRALERCGAWGEAREALRTSEELDPLPPSLEGVKGRQLSYARRIDLSLMRRPQYAYALLRAATLAARLETPRIAAIELGVAGGTGLVWMERHATDVTAMTGIEIDVYGFDTGEGLVAPRDERDLPYLFAEGNYEMDLAELRANLADAELVLGDAAETFPRFLASATAPVGVLAFDMDLYAPTRAVLDALGDDADERLFLPRLPVYFDNTVGRGEQDYNEFTGELLALREFNEGNDETRLAGDRRFRTLPLNYAWHHGMHVLHRFGHPAYRTYVSDAGPDSLALQ
jgi:tetratricopeptide (TPR) repeat protein